MSTVLRMRGVSVTFGSGADVVRPLVDVDLDVSAGEIVLVHGPSGSGKSSLLHVAAGLLVPDAGAVDRPGGDRPSWWDVAIVPQSLGLLAELSVGENVTCAVTGPVSSSGVEQVRAVLAALDLEHLQHRAVDELSVGQQQRVAVARAVVAAPRLLVADEPTSSQDLEHADAVLAAVRSCAERGTACIVAAHDPRLESLATRTVHLDAGHLRAGN